MSTGDEVDKSMISNENSPTVESNSDRLEAAFPLADHGEILASGLTKRELFAALAMQGLLAADRDRNLSSGQVASYAVQQANVLVTELKRQSRAEEN